MVMKNIFVYDSVVSPIGQRGVNRYFLKFLDALVNSYEDQVLVYSQQDLNLGHLSQIQPYSGSKYIKSFSRVRKVAQILDRLFATNIANRSASLFYSPYFGSVKAKVPQIYTLPDMIYEKLPQYFDPANMNYQKFMKEKRSCFERAALILPISRSAARDLQESYPQLSPDQIKVVYLGVDDLFFTPAVPDKASRPYLLFVGNRDRYKNFLRFIHAFGSSGLQKKFDLRIVSPYENDFTFDERNAIARYDLVDCIRMEHSISDESLKEYYAAAYAFVYPSEYEGFGLPVIEALASGTLVLTSNTSSLPEVGGSAPLYFDPVSIDSMIDTLQTASEMTTSERNERIQAGKNWAMQFTWENSQRSFLSVIQEMLQDV